MDIDTLDWSLLRSFLAVIDAGSLLGAARRLGSHQPTVSRQIATLESQLGLPLFERTGRGLRPTTAGLAIVESARQMSDSAQALALVLRGLNSRIEGSVRVSCSQVMASTLMPECLANLRLKHPALQIDLVASNQVSNLLRREADVALRMVQPVQGSLVARRIGTLQMGAFASSDYLVRRKAPRTLRDLADHALVGLDQDDTLVRALAASGLALGREDFGVRTDDQVAYIRLVQEGAGVGFMPVAVAASVPNLSPVLTGMSIIALPIWLAVHREIAGNPLIRIVFDHIAEFVPARLAADVQRGNPARIGA